MACIAQQKNGALPPALSKQCVKAVHGRAPDLNAGRIDKTGDLLYDVLIPAELLRSLAWQQLDFSAPQIARTGNEGRWPGRPAVLNTLRRQLHRALDTHVHHHPPFVEA